MIHTATDRQSIRCTRCQLNQFVAPRCRKCKAALPHAPEPLVIALQTPKVVPIAVADTVGARICQMRHARQLSQARLGQRMGCTRTYISKIERGEAGPTLISLARFARAMECTVVELLPSDPVGEYMAVIARYVGRLNARQRKAVLSMARAMVEPSHPGSNNRPDSDVQTSTG